MDLDYDPASQELLTSSYGEGDVRYQRGGFRAAVPLLLFYGLVGTSLYGVSYNIVLYMTTQLGFSNAEAATHVNLWTFTHDLSPLVVGYIADAHLGRPVATLAFAVIFVTGMMLLTTAAVVGGGGAATVVFFVALYMIALGKGMGAPLMAFSADQFDHDRSSFFSWSYFSSAAGLLTAVLGVVYLSDAVGFVAAAGASAAAAAAGLAVATAAAAVGVYRYRPREVGISLWRSAYSRIRTSNGALVWLGSIVFEALKSQTFSLFIEQATTMDTTILSFRVPPASLNCFDPLSVMVWTIIYDKIIRRFAKTLTSNPKGLSLWQRMAIGLFLMAMAMVSAASLEATRLSMYHSSGAKISVLWQIPQFSLVGASKVFYYVGLTEFLYEEAPRESKSIGSSLAFLSASFGSLASGLLVNFTSKITGKDGWIPQHLNHGHLDYFFWMLAGFGVINWLLFLGT